MIFTIKPIVSLVVLFSSSVLAQKAFSSTVSGVTWLPEPSVDPQTIPIVPVTIIKSISSHLASATANPPSVPTGVVPIINTAVLHTAVLETSAPTTTTAGSVSSVKPASPTNGSGHCAIKQCCRLDSRCHCRHLGWRGVQSSDLDVTLPSAYFVRDYKDGLYAL
ncbi:hypothetical protein BASA62_001846 [Batrachochytrium salamandrivorans]|nr:hypothetical protein BASA62_001846 [Batrachochytrium salamandrivorans]